MDCDASGTPGRQFRKMDETGLIKYFILFQIYTDESFPRGSKYEFYTFFIRRGNMAYDLLHIATDF
jgi:hypothetical protein